ncbi:MAG: nitroreductase family protein [candidate division WOR-3 bacterium]
MDCVYRVIKKRRSFRSLEPVKIDNKLIKNLTECAILAPSCYNKQPERFIFVKSKKNLKKVFESLPEGNRWATKASMVIIVYSKKDYDCVIKEREYYLFDTGISVGFLILRATEIGLVAHTIAGYDVEKIKRNFNLQNDDNIIALIIIGKHSLKVNDLMSDWQKEQETKRPIRRKFKEVAIVV